VVGQSPNSAPSPDHWGIIFRMGCLFIPDLFCAVSLPQGNRDFCLRAVLQFQTVAFMPLIWRKPKLLPVEPALLAGLLRQTGCESNTQQSARRGAAICPNRGPFPSLPPALPVILARALAWHSPETRGAPRSPAQPPFDPPQRGCSESGGFLGVGGR